MSRKGENIYKRKDGRWEGRYIKGYDSNNKAIYGYVYAKSYREVKNKMISFKRDIQNGHFQTAQLKEEIVLLQDITNEWLTDIRCQIKDSTYIKYRNMIQSYIIPEIVNYPINNLTIECLNSFFQSYFKMVGKIIRDYLQKQLPMSCRWSEICFAMQRQKEWMYRVMQERL